MANEAFDVTELFRIFGCNKTRGSTRRLHPSRPANSMDIIFRAMRQIEIDHVTDIGHIDTPCGNICRDEHAEDSAFKPIERTSTLRKTSIPVQDANTMSCTTEHTPHMICPMLGPGKDQHGLLLLFQERKQ
jgi:hypothetical protein